VFRISLRVGAGFLVLGTAWALAQSTGDSQSGPQLPVGQTFKQFEYPLYQKGILQATFSAVSATGITLNRAETTDLIIKTYDPGNNQVPTTTITTPKADLYVNDQKMRTKDTVDIERADMSATAQICDFDQKTKKYLLRTNVRVVLKHFDLNTGPNGTPAAASAVKPISSVPAAVQPARDNSALLDSPGSYSDTHSAPIAPSTEAK